MREVRSQFGRQAALLTCLVAKARRGHTARLSGVRELRGLLPAQTGGERCYRGRGSELNGAFDYQSAARPVKSVGKHPVFPYSRQDPCAIMETPLRRWCAWCLWRARVPWYAGQGLPGHPAVPRASMEVQRADLSGVGLDRDGSEPGLTTFRGGQRVRRKT